MPKNFTQFIIVSFMKFRSRNHRFSKMKLAFLIVVFVTVFVLAYGKHCNGYCEFDCGNGTCIPERLFCDGEDHCGNGKDEPLGCPKCEPDEFQCANGNCVWMGNLCNNIDDCGDWSDEYEDCPSCPPFTFECKIMKRCLPDFALCDGWDDCGDGSDERDCTCPNKCLDGTCLKDWMICDGYIDCIDGSDESVDCPPCGNDRWQCANGKCISIYQICDGYNNCGDGSDETKPCPPCPEEYWTCTSSGQCMGAYTLCDGYDDCGDWSDEGCELCESLVPKGKGIIAPNRSSVKSNHSYRKRAYQHVKASRKGYERLNITRNVDQDMKPNRQ